MARADARDHGQSWRGSRPISVLHPGPTENGKCEVQPFDVEEYTVPALFELARSMAQFDEGKWTEIEFDPTYGYPTSISYDHPEILDEDSYWGVQSFEVLD